MLKGGKVKVLLKKGKEKQSAGVRNRIVQFGLMLLVVVLVVWCIKDSLECCGNKDFVDQQSVRRRRQP